MLNKTLRYDNKEDYIFKKKAGNTTYWFDIVGEADKHFRQLYRIHNQEKIEISISPLEATVLSRCEDRTINILSQINNHYTTIFRVAESLGVIEKESWNKEIEELREKRRNPWFHCLIK